MADDQIRLCAHMMPVSEELSVFWSFGGFFASKVGCGIFFFFFILIYHWSICYFAKPNAAISFEIFI